MVAIWTWLTAHQMVFGSLIMGILDFIIAVSPGIDSNGIFHAIYTTVKGFFTPPTAPSA